jgi:hypothetical protein
VGFVRIVEIRAASLDAGVELAVTAGEEDSAEGRAAPALADPAGG